MPPNQATNGRGYQVITTLRDLQSKYRRDKDAVRTTWLSLSPEQRKEVILAGSAGGESGFLRHPDDTSLGRVRYVIPELNLRDLLPGEALLDLLEIRATTPITDIYITDVNFMRTSMYNNKFNHPTGRMSGAVTMFTEEENWGDGFEVTASAPKNILNGLIERGKGYVLSENEGFMVLDRQAYIYGFLSIVVDDILDMKRRIEDPDADKRLPKRTRPSVQKLAILTPEASRASKSKQKASSSEPTGKTTHTLSREQQLARLIADAQAALFSTEDHISLLREEPLYLSHIASHFFFSTPGIIPDDAGITELVNTASTATIAVLDLIKDAYTTHAYWQYISTLTSSNLATDIWEACNQELLRARNVFRRFVTTEPKYTKFFVRTSQTSPETSAPPDLAFKAPLETIPKKAQFTFWILSLADAVPLTYKEVLKLLKQMDDFIERVPAARENISERMGNALADIAVITAFMERFQGVFTPTKGMSEVVGRVEKKVQDLEQIWNGVDFVEWAWPVDNLKGKEAALGLWGAVDAGLEGGLGGAFEEVVKRCTEYLTGGIEEPLKIAGPAKLEAIETIDTPDKAETPLITLERTENIPARTVRKSKKLPATSSTTFHAPSITTTTTTIATPPSALKTFRKIFRKDPTGSSGSIPWSAFMSAMTSIGFSVESIGGSVARFRPPEGSGKGWHPVNLHRPHPSDRFEGWALLKLKKRLTRCYGWEMETFIAGKK